MKVATVAGLFALNLAADAGAAPAPLAPSVPPAGAAPLRLTDPAIERAVRETLAGTKESGPLAQGSAFSGNPAFAKAFAKAAVPSCLGPDALKHQPTSISTKNWTFGVSGIFAIPFWVAAAARGKCQ
jgi:hypothetical protein